MNVEFRRFDATAAREHRDLVQQIYERSYAEAIASGDPFEQPEAFMGRFDAYTDPARAAGFDLVVGYLDGNPVGQSWGWPLVAGTAWWNGLRLDAGDPDEFTREDGTRTFALSEIMVAAEHTGRGVARALHDHLLAGRSEQRATLLVDPHNDRAYRAYRRWGWERVGVLRPRWPDAPTFDVLIRPIVRR